MALTKDTTFKRMTIQEDAQVDVEWLVVWYEDAVEDTRQQRYQHYDVEDDVSGLPTVGQDVCAAAWTPAIVQARLDQINLILTDGGYPAESTLAAAKAALAAINGI